MINISICENDDCKDVLVYYIKKFFGVNSYYIDKFKNSEELIYKYKRNCDILFLSLSYDENQNLKGMDIAKKIRSIDKRVLIIFSAYTRELARHGYEVDAFRFLDKPYNYYIFSRYMRHALVEIKKNKTVLKIEIKGNIFELKLNSIFYIEIRDNLIFHTEYGDLVCQKNINLEKELKYSNFYWCSNFCIINLNLLESIDTIKKLVCVAGNIINIRNDKIKELLNMF